MDPSWKTSSDSNERTGKRVSPIDSWSDRNAHFCTQTLSWVQSSTFGQKTGRKCKLFNPLFSPFWFCLLSPSLHLCTSLYISLPSLFERRSFLHTQCAPLLYALSSFILTSSFNGSTHLCIDICVSSNIQSPQFYALDFLSLQETECFDYYALFVQEDRDTAILMLLKSFLGSVPQIMLQAFIWTKSSSSNSNTSSSAVLGSTHIPGASFCEHHFVHQLFFFFFSQAFYATLFVAHILHPILSTLLLQSFVSSTQSSS